MKKKISLLFTLLFLAVICTSIICKATDELAPLLPSIPGTTQPDFSVQNQITQDNKKVVDKKKQILDFEKEIINIDWKFWAEGIIKIFLIIIISISIWKSINLGVQKYLKNIKIFKRIAENKGSETSALIKTVVPIVKSIFHWALIILTSMLVLSELGFNIAPLFFSLSFFGLAVSFGAKELVKDLINGILTLFEGNMAVGDIVCIGKNIGTVESMSLRAILLRHFTGELQTIPFSEASSLTNCSRDFNVAPILLTVTPEAKIAAIQESIDQAYRSMKSDADYSHYIRSKPSTVGVKSMTSTGIIVCSSISTIPDPRKNFLNEFNKRLFEELQTRNVPFAFVPNTSEQ